MGILGVYLRTMSICNSQFLICAKAYRRNHSWAHIRIFCQSRFEHPILLPLPTLYPTTNSLINAMIMPHIVGSFRANARGLIFPQGTDEDGRLVATRWVICTTKDDNIIFYNLLVSELKPGFRRQMYLQLFHSKEIEGENMIVNEDETATLCVGMPLVRRMLSSRLGTIKNTTSINSM